MILDYIFKIWIIKYIQIKYISKMYGNANMAAMGGMGGMGGMGMVNMTGFPMMGLGNMNLANMFMYSGNCIGLQSKLESLNTTDIGNIKQANIVCTGTQITQMSLMCILCTTIWGSILIFPLFFMCCDWWKRIAYPSYNIPETTYQSLQYLFQAPNLQTLTMTVIDNRLNTAKAQMLYDLLSRSRLKGFTLVNSAQYFDLQSDEYSNFQQHFRPIKKLPIVSQIKWGTKLVM